MNLALLKVFTRLHTALYRLTGGRVMGSFGKAPVLLLTTTGRKSGKKRTLPLLYLKQDEAYFVVASAGGAPRHPAWYLNLVASPEAELRVKHETIPVTAETVSSEDKTKLWPRFTAMFPDYDTYQERTEREIPVVRLTRNRAP